MAIRGLSKRKLKKLASILDKVKVSVALKVGRDILLSKPILELFEDAGLVDDSGMVTVEAAIAAREMTEVALEVLDAEE